MGGAAYVRALKGPFPQARFIASGGVNQQTAADFIRAGASAIGVGQDLLPRDAIRVHNAQWIHELTRRFITMVQEARGH
jgi:2-dehydro-3-deoxyphosphogluconate aldolase/(4S)-4-hydroxy-2-oxoglutarate aldolase